MRGERQNDFEKLKDVSVRSRFEEHHDTMNELLVLKLLKRRYSVKCELESALCTSHCSCICEARRREAYTADRSFLDRFPCFYG